MASKTYTVRLIIEVADPADFDVDPLELVDPDPKTWDWAKMVETGVENVTYCGVDIEEIGA